MTDVEYKLQTLDVESVELEEEVVAYCAGKSLGVLQKLDAMAGKTQEAESSLRDLSVTDQSDGVAVIDVPFFVDKLKKKKRKKTLR